MTETEFAEKVSTVARLCGWKISHFGPGRTNKGWRTAVRYDGKGMVDWVMVHPARRLVWFRELKTDRGQLDGDQKKWRDALINAGANWDVWRPRDFVEIVNFLTDGKGGVL